MKSKKQKLKVKHTGLRCLVCEDIIFSESVHDFKFCACNNCFVDGGHEYFRYGFVNRKYIKQVYLYSDGTISEDFN